MQIVVRVRRWFCDLATCARRTFAEQMPRLSVRYGRRTAPLRSVLESIAMALAGRAGARLARRVADVVVSRMTLLRWLRGMPDPQAATPRVLGVDDFALRRGHVYGTVLIDIETHRPVDLLANREASTLADWLRKHPGVEIVCRDRAGAYAEGVRSGAPLARQVADRWHLWHNLGEAVERAVVRHRAHLREPEADTEIGPDDTSGVIEAKAPNETGPADGDEAPLVVRTRERYAAVQGFMVGNISRGAISRRLGLDPQTVRRYADAASVDELLAKTTSRSTLLDAYKPYLNQRWDEGCTDAVRLCAEIRARGYTGTDRTVRRYVRPFRALPSAPAAAVAPPKVRDVVGWLMRSPDELDPEAQQRLTAILGRSPQLDALAGHVRTFATMIRKLQGEHLPEWMTGVRADDLPDLHSFVAGLERDLPAVTAGLTLPYSSGPVEGHVNRIKMLKRQMFGRADFDLLRKRVLLAT